MNYRGPVYRRVDSEAGIIFSLKEMKNPVRAEKNKENIEVIAEMWFLISLKEAKKSVQVRKNKENIEVIGLTVIRN